MYIFGNFHPSLCHLLSLLFFANLQRKKGLGVEIEKQRCGYCSTKSWKRKLSPKNFIWWVAWEGWELRYVWMGLREVGSLNQRGMQCWTREPRIWCLSECAFISYGHQKNREVWVGVCFPRGIGSHDCRDGMLEPVGWKLSRELILQSWGRTSRAYLGFLQLSPLVWSKATHSVDGNLLYLKSAHCRC